MNSDTDAKDNGEAEGVGYIVNVYDKQEYESNGSQYLSCTSNPLMSNDKN